jgi:hypothetical protein
MQVRRNPVNSRIDDYVTAEKVVFCEKDTEIRRNPRGVIREFNYKPPQAAIFAGPRLLDWQLNVDFPGIARGRMTEPYITLEFALVAWIITSGDHEHFDMGAEFSEGGGESRRGMRSDFGFSMVPFYDLGLAEFTGKCEAPGVSQGLQFACCKFGRHFWSASRGVFYWQQE